MIINSPRSGKIGKDGLTPHIGENGNWFLGDTDTGISASSKSATTIQTIALLATAWVDGTQTVVCSGASADATSQTVTVAADIASKKAYADAGVICTEVGTDELTFTADIAPSVDLVVYVAIEQAGGTVASGPSNDAYSTEETVIGTWIDGRPLYQRTFVSTISTNTSLQDFSISKDINSNDCLLVEATGSFYAGGAYQEISGIYSFTSNDVYMCSSVVLGTNHLKVILRDCTTRDVGIYLNVKYIRFADTAIAAIPDMTALMSAYEEGVNEA